MKTSWFQYGFTFSTRNFCLITTAQKYILHWPGLTFTSMWVFTKNKVVYPVFFNLFAVWCSFYLPPEVFWQSSIPDEETGEINFEIVSTNVYLTNLIFISYVTFKYGTKTFIIYLWYVVFIMKKTIEISLQLINWTISI